MYTEQTTIVDCYQNSNEDYVLDMPAKELLEASKTGAVYVRFNHSGQQTIEGTKKDITDYRTSRLKSAYYDGTAYTFAFESGDTYTISGDGYPVLDGESPSETLSGGGSGGGVLVVTDTDGTLDKTWQEMYDAFASGGVVIQMDENKRNGVFAVTKLSRDTFDVVAYDGLYYSASSASGYPLLS